MSSYPSDDLGGVKISRARKWGWVLVSKHDGTLAINALRRWWPIVQIGIRVHGALAHTHYVWGACCDYSPENESLCQEADVILRKRERCTALIRTPAAIPAQITITRTFIAELYHLGKKRRKKLCTEQWRQGERTRRTLSPRRWRDC